MASQEFAHSHWTGMVVVGLILLIIVVLITFFLSFGQQEGVSQTRFSLNMKRSNGADTMTARNRGNTMVIHDAKDDGSECDLELELRPNYKGRSGRRILVKNNTSHSVIKFKPIDGLTFDGGHIENALIVKPGAYANLLYIPDSTMLRLQ